MGSKVIWGVILVSLVITGCAKEQTYKSSTSMQTVSTSSFDAQLEPLRAEGYNYYNRFRFVFTNKTNKDLIIVWSETYYLQNGRENGLFGWEGLTFEELKAVKAEPDLTAVAGKTETSIIFPLNLIGWREEGARMKAKTPEAGFTNGVIPAGENGMSLAVRQNGKLVREKILVNIALD